MGRTARFLSGFEKSSFKAPLSTGEEVEHDIYSKGEGPIIVILQELPGIDRDTESFANRLIDKGFRVVLPHLLGPLGKTSHYLNIARAFFCMRREFSLFENRKSGPIVDWLRALCQQLRSDHGVTGVGVIGMCLTGNFAISLIADDAVLASVASQPSLPFGSQHSLQMSPEEVVAVRAAIDEKGPLKAYRFEGDSWCKAAKFDGLRISLNDGKERISTKTLPGNAHAVLTGEFRDEEGHPTYEAFVEVVDYFQTRLSGTTAA